RSTSIGADAPSSYSSRVGRAPAGGGVGSPRPSVDGGRESPGTADQRGSRLSYADQRGSRPPLARIRETPDPPRVPAVTCTRMKRRLAAIALLVGVRMLSAQHADTVRNPLGTDPAAVAA